MKAKISILGEAAMLVLAAGAAQANDRYRQRRSWW
jgi:hypothetical protein